MTHAALDIVRRTRTDRSTETYFKQTLRVEIETARGVRSHREKESGANVNKAVKQKIRCSLSSIMFFVFFLQCGDKKM